MLQYGLQYRATVRVRAYTKGGQCYKTFDGRILRIFVFNPGMPSLSSLKFVGKARRLP
jgi:hypothetical protein